MNEDRLIKLGRYIRQLREAEGLSQEELAKKSGFAGRAAISAIEKGKNNISVDRLPDLARSLHTTPGKLMDVLVEQPNDLASEGVPAMVKFSKLDRIDQAKTEAYIDGLLAADKYKKDTEAGLA